MSSAQILKSMRHAPILSKSTYNRWSSLFSDVLSLYDLQHYILEEVPDLKVEDSRTTSAARDIQKVDMHIRIAMSQLVPDIAFHLVHSTYTSKECWDNLREFYCPNPSGDLDDLLEEFWGVSIEDDDEVDEFVQKLSEIRNKISLLSANSRPTDSSMKKRLLSHFSRCCGGFYMSVSIPLRSPEVSFTAAVTSIRAAQSVYQELHPTSVVALLKNEEENGSTKSPDTSEKKQCAYCKRSGHIREACFKWLNTPDGSKWAAKNPEKAARTRSLQKRLQQRRHTGSEPELSSSASKSN